MFFFYQLLSISKSYLQKLILIINIFNLQNFGCSVQGIDWSKFLIDIAIRRHANKYEKVKLSLKNLYFYKIQLFKRHKLA